MAGRRIRPWPTSRTSHLALAAFLLFAAAILFLLFTFSPLAAPSFTVFSSASCDYSDGLWVVDPRPASRYPHTCKEIFKGWNCVANGKSNSADITRWRWRRRPSLSSSSSCPDFLPHLDPVSFLRRYRNTNIGFIGDSLNRNMFTSLVCMLMTTVKEREEVHKWRPAGADRGFTFVRYNLTIAYHRTNLLVRYGRWSATASNNSGSLELLGYKQGYRVDVDIPEHTWVDAPKFHNIIVLNTGHWWWAPSKFDPVHSPMLFFDNGMPITPPLSPPEGMDLALKNMIRYVDDVMGFKGVKYFRTQSPRHFEGGDWNQGGSCQRLQPLSPEQVEDIFSLDNNGTNSEVRLVNKHLLKAVENSSFHLLDITRMSEFRADAHPSTTGGKKHDDCMHWCLPGLTDTWNDLLAASLNTFFVRSY